MDFKSILLAGGHIQFSFKQNPTDWVGEGKIYGLAPNFGIEAMIVVDVPCEEGHYKQFSYDKIDDAIELYKSLVFSEKNLWYRHHEALIEVNDPDLDLEIEEDFAIYEAKRLEIINKEK